LPYFLYNKPMLTAEEVKKVAEMARIELKEEEVEKFQKDLSSVLEYVEELQQVDTDGLEIVSSVTGLENIQRADVAQPIEYQEEILANAPERKEKYYKVKSIL
jgi:aspartyl-tRNA(Asn)/glutamyl-tRNA(Gln) amidotransferase subunit C